MICIKNACLVNLDYRSRASTFKNLYIIKQLKYYPASLEKLKARSSRNPKIFYRCDMDRKYLLAL